MALLITKYTFSGLKNLISELRVPDEIIIKEFKNYFTFLEKDDTETKKEYEKILELIKNKRPNLLKKIN